MNDNAQYDVISSTRSWRFAMDDIRLSSMANTRFVAFIKETFGFIDPEDADLLFEPFELGTFPQPMVFRSGLAPTSVPKEGDRTIEEVAVRRLSISATQISVEVAGPTSLAVSTFDFFRYLISDARTPEGKPYIGEPISHRDHSLIVVRRPGWSSSSLLNEQVRELISHSFVAAAGQELVPEIEIASYSELEPTESRSGTGRTWRLSLRFGTVPSDQFFESAAALSSNDHLEFLFHLSESFAAEQ